MNAKNIPFNRSKTLRTPHILKLLFFPKIIQPFVETINLIASIFVTKFLIFIHKPSKKFFLSFSLQHILQPLLNAVCNLDFLEKWFKQLWCIYNHAFSFVTLSVRYAKIWVIDKSFIEQRRIESTNGVLSLFVVTVVWLVIDE